MPTFNYLAIRPNGKRQKGVLAGDTERQVRSQLRAQHLLPIKVTQIHQGPKFHSRGLSLFKKGLSHKDLSLTTRQMATLLSSGIPIDEVLASVAKQTEKKYVTSVLLGVRAKVMEGFSLARAMEEFPHAFPKLYRTTISAGERSAKLDQVLLKLADYIEAQRTIRQKISQALIYPSLMTVVSLGVVMFLLIYVVPQIVGVFTENQQVLPKATQILIESSHFLKHRGVDILLGLGVGVFLWIKAYRKISFKSKVHQLGQKLPLLGKNLKIINCARFGRTFGILNAATVPVLEAMNAACDLITLIPMQKSVKASIELVREGGNIHTALEKTGYFPPMFLHLVASGEAGGQLNLMLDKAALSLENDVEVLIQNLLTLFEPAMILMMGSIVLYIVLAIMLPIFNLDQFTG